MTLSDYRSTITAAFTEMYGPDVEFPDSFDHDTEVRFTTHTPVDDAIASLGADWFPVTAGEDR